MTRHIVTGSNDTGTIFTVEANSATEALTIEDGMIEAGYTHVSID